MSQGAAVGPHKSTVARLSAASQVVLVVCETDDDTGTRALDRLGQGFVQVDIQQVGAELLETLKPDIIISPLISRSFDCIDLAQILGGLGYRGIYRAVTTALPAPDLIRREISNLCPGLKFDLTFFKS